MLCRIPYVCVVFGAVFTDIFEEARRYALARSEAMRGDMQKRHCLYVDDMYPAWFRMPKPYELW